MGVFPSKSDESPLEVVLEKRFALSSRPFVSHGLQFRAGQGQFSCPVGKYGKEAYGNPWQKPMAEPRRTPSGKPVGNQRKSWETSNNPWQNQDRHPVGPENSSAVVETHLSGADSTCFRRVSHNQNLLNPVHGSG